MMKSDNWVRLPEWDGQDLRALLRLDRVGPQQFRNRYGDPNENGRSYGGQLLGQALMAASADVSPDRCATAMQFLFLQGAMHDQPLDIQVTALQDGKRFSSRHVRGVQPGGRVVLDAHVTFALPSPSPSHTESSTAQESPTTLVRLRDLPQEYTQRLNLLGGYSLVEKACMDFRLADAEVALTALQAPCARFWIRALMQTHEPRMHEGAFAYLSDFWLNFSSLGSHTQELAVNGRAIYVSSLNHTIWFHTPFTSDTWLHFDSRSSRAEAGRGLSIAKVHDEQGTLVATVTQECLIAYADTPIPVPVATPDSPALI